MTWLNFRVIYKAARFAALSGAAFMPLSQAAAAQTDPMIEGAKLCTRHLPRLEREYAIPTHLLSAIASTESGRYHSGLGMKLPWPWSINANGKGYWFETKEEAIAAVKKLRASGIKSIDIGCMQVNLHHHPEAFASLSEAFEPQINIAYAAGFLRNLYDQGGSWKKAAGDYHSRTPSLGNKYVGNVYGSWYTIIDKLRTARLNVPESSVAAMRELKGSKTASQAASSTVTTSRVSPHVIRIASADTASASRPKLVEQQNRQVAPFEPARMNSIRVSTQSAATDLSRSERNKSAIFVRTESAPAASTPPVAVAPAVTSAAPAQVPAPAPATTTPAVNVVAPAGTSAYNDLALTPAPVAVTPPNSEIKLADSSLAQASLQTPVQKILVNPVTGRTVDTQQLSDLAPASGRRSLASQPVRKSGPNFIFND